MFALVAQCVEETLNVLAVKSHRQSGPEKDGMHRHSRISESRDEAGCENQCDQQTETEQ